MAVRGSAELMEALTSERPQDLLGTHEAAWVDFKRDAYDLRSPRDKWELAKDVAALANADGGLLVCGVNALREQHEPVEMASELWPLSRVGIDLGAYKHVLLDGIQPPPVISMRWFAHPADLPHDRVPPVTEPFYLVIEVSPLPERERYAVLRRVVDAGSGKVVDGIAVPIRHGDDTRWLTAYELQRLIRDGGQPRVNEPQETSLASSPSPAEIVSRLERRQEWEDVPAVFWQSTPDQRPPLLDGWLEEVRDALRDPKALRGSGFNFANPYEQVRQEDELLIVADRRMVMSVSMNGIVTAGALATSEFLGWAMAQQGLSGRLNVIAVTEVMLEYFRFADTTVLPRVPGSHWRHRLIARRCATADPPVSLGEGQNPIFPFRGREANAASDDWVQDWPARGDVSGDTMEGLARLYALFGLPASANPFVGKGPITVQSFLESLPPG